MYGPSDLISKSELYVHEDQLPEIAFMTPGQEYEVESVIKLRSIRQEDGQPATATFQVVAIKKKFIPIEDMTTDQFRGALAQETRRAVEGS